MGNLIQNNRGPLTLFVGGVMAFIIFSIHRLVELGVAGGVPHVLVILIGFWSRSRKVMISLAILCSLFTLWGWWLSPLGGESWKVASNRFLALLAIWVTTFLCILHQLKAEQLVQSRVSLDTIFNSSPAMIWYKDEFNRIVKVNSVAAQMTGLPREEIEGRMMDEVYPNRSDDFHAYDLEVIRTDKPRLGVIEELNSPGGMIWVQTDRVPYHNADGKVQGVIVFSKDITEKRRADEQLTLLSTAIEQSSTAVMITDREGNIEYVNSSFAENSGYSIEQLIGQSPNILKSGEHSPEFYSNLWSTVLSGEIWRGELVNRHRGGRLYTELVAIHPVRNSRDAITHFVWIRIDDVERQNTLKQLRTYAKELARSNKELEEFASIASHDIQEPLKKIISFSEKIQMGYKPLLDERGVNYLNRIIQASERLRHLVRDLISLARVSGPVQVVAPTDLNRLVKEVRVDLEFIIEEKEAVIEVSDLPVIEANSSQIHQLFQNLISNALKFHKKHIPPRIRIYCQNLNEEFCEIVVQDEGIGFDETYSERVFKPFERLHSILDGYTGSGIGLALCRKVVESHGGIINARSQPGQGTTVTVRLPVKQEDIHSMPQELI